MAPRTADRKLKEQSKKGVGRGDKEARRCEGGITMSWSDVDVKWSGVEVRK